MAGRRGPGAEGSFVEAEGQRGTAYQSVHCVELFINLCKKQTNDASVLTAVS